ncbi:hypothetical protein VLK31_15525 [Variovorax sp. H27-G14]|uniref:hypothetical protein n=1 Tax=Variovorax sp. H27-G14 TaxID=3111914 RepID=UPI0038FC415E
MSDEFTLRLHGENSASAFIQLLGESEFCANKSEKAISLKDKKIKSAGRYDIGVQKISNSDLFLDRLFYSKDLYDLFKKTIGGRPYIIIDDIDENISLEEMFGINKMQEK